MAVPSSNDNPFQNSASAPTVPADLAADVLTLAAQLQVQQQDAYTLDDLVAAGAEANIDPAYIHQAMQQVQDSMSHPEHLPAETTADDGVVLGRVGVVAGVAVVALLGLTLLGSPVGMGCHARMAGIERDRF